MFFFFQAEDGIRDGRVTGVQTCALPISQLLTRLEAGQGTEEDLETLLDVADNILGKSFCALGDGAASPIQSSLKYFRDEYRSEERRVGKEGRCRGGPYH